MKFQRKRVVKSCVIIVLCCMITLLCRIPVSAAESDYQYSVNENNEVTITRYVGTETDVVIPDTLGGGKVTSIGEKAFYCCSSLRSVQIPEGVTSIGDFAFECCSSLSSVLIPEGVTSIGSYAFVGCSSLSSVTIPEGVTSIGSYAFYCCSSLRNVTIPEGVTSIGYCAFGDCSGLKTAGAIGSGANIEFDWKTTIPRDAFGGCSSLRSVLIPEGVMNIAGSAFRDCSSLSSVTIPEGVTSIGYNAFSGCRSLSSVKIPEGVTSIGHHAFYCCSSLSSVTIPEGVTSIGSCAFGGCSSLSSVVIPEGVTSISSFVLSDCSSLSSVLIPEGVTSICDKAFYGCSSLSSVLIPEGVTSIGESAFEECTSLSSVLIPKNVTKISNYAFRNCTSLEKVFIKSKKVQIGDFVFFRAPLTIHGYADSDVEAYAKDNKINFIALPNMEKVSAFAERLYTLVLGREADGNGLDSWSDALTLHESSGVDVGYGFVFSDECKKRNLSDEEFVDMLYLTFMDRPSDEAGRNAWVSQLEIGVEREKIFEGFVYSDEFRGICEEYKIELGNTESVDAFAEALSHYCNQNADITAFVARCYTKAMGRPYDPVGLEDWCRVIITQDDTPSNVAKCFILSDEFAGKNLSDEEYVKVLYRTFMGREADEEGLAGWVDVLQSGTEDREKVLEGFANSLEFAAILEGFGLN